MVNNPSNIDLNLLRVFLVLMEERSVSRAADRLFLSQPATSNALNRLRDALGDRLLVRNGNTMEPTERAISFLPHITDAMDRLKRGLEELESFDPMQLETSIRIGIDQYSLEVFGKQLLTDLRISAPKLHIELINIKPHQNEDDLGRGKLDFILGQLWDATPGSDRHILATEEFVGLARHDHPIFKDKSFKSIDSYLSFPHLLFSEVGRVQRNVDFALSRKALSRKISATLPSLTLAAEIVEQSDNIVNLGGRMSHALQKRYGLRQFPIPFDVPSFDLGLLWASRNSDGPMNRWFRSIALKLG